MWDVKVATYNDTQDGYKFYLNYVGCKDICVSFNSCRNFGFTLTMWDVKIMRFSSGSNFKFVLP